MSSKNTFSILNIIPVAAMKAAWANILYYKRSYMISMADREADRTPLRTLISYF